MTGASGFTERAFNVALGLSLLAWTTRHLRDTFKVLDFPTETLGSAFCWVQLLLAALTVLVALLIMCRSPVRRDGNWRAVAWALPTVGIGAAAFQGVDPHAWSGFTVALLALGEILTVASFISLGKSFAVLPSLRQVVVRGPYRWVRHPAYAGEMLMLGACVVAETSPALLSIWLAALVFLVPRILEEERLLLSSDEYSTYRQKVRFRLVPGVW